MNATGSKERELVFCSAKGAKVIIDGTDLITGDWEAIENGIYRVPLKAETEQVFFEKQGGED